MAAVSTPHAGTILTPPSSSHGTSSTSWNFSVPNQSQGFYNKELNHRYDINPNSNESAIEGQKKVAMLSHSSSRPDLSQKRADTVDSNRSLKSHYSGDGHYLAPSRLSALNRKDSNISEAGSAPDSLLDLYGNRGSFAPSMESAEARNGESFGKDDESERSRWIHRDKLAQIESRELQAAGIVLPRTTNSSRPGARNRSSSRDQLSNGNSRSEQQPKRQRVAAVVAEGDENANWDLRSPEEIADGQNMYGSWSSGKGISRLPLPKNSPVPIPLDHITRDTPTQRKSSGGWTGDDTPIAYPKPRGRSGSVKALEDPVVIPVPTKRSATDQSPKKNGTSTVRKPSVTSANRATSAQARPKTRSGSTAKENQRPPTRSGEASANTKAPEGDPPWLATMYKPDPRLPPDQQLLPTHAKRLQQEQWEKEGKFGNAYDTEFRPMNEDQFHQPPDTFMPADEITSEKAEGSEEWPLRGPKSPTLSTGRPGTAGGYSTMPKIKDSVPDPLQSPMPATATQEPPIQVIRMQEPQEEPKKKGCGLCIVM